MEIAGMMFALLRLEMNGNELCEELKNLITPEVLPALFKLAKRHDLAHLVGDALDKNGLLPENSEAKKRFVQERNMAVYRYEQIEYEIDRICQVLEQEKLAFMKLKGAVLRDYYPQPWMRTSCDIDILVKEEDLERAIEVLKEKLAYQEGTKGAHDVNLYAPSGVHLELHFSLTESDDRWKSVLNDVWAKTWAGWQYSFAMTNEMFYLYHIVHMAVHMRTGGCGVKPFLDLHILNKKMHFSREELERLLNKGNLLAFEQEATKLSNAWFLEAESDEIGEALQQYVLYGGVYGVMDNRIAVQQVKQGGKFAYLLSRIFVSFKELSIKYPSLKKRKILFPLYQIYRWFDLLINKKSRQYTKATIIQTKSTAEQKRQDVKKLFEAIGL